MFKRVPAKSGDEYDAFSVKVRKWLRWRAGERSAIKRAYNKRFRKAAKAECKGQVWAE